MFVVFGFSFSFVVFVILSSFFFLRRYFFYSLAIRFYRIYVFFFRWFRLEEVEELDTSEESLFRRESFMERMDLESVFRSLGGMVGGVGFGLRVFFVLFFWVLVIFWG